MLKISQKLIDLENSTVLYKKQFTEDNLKSDWEITGGDWTVKDGWLTGYYAENGGGLVYTLENYPGDIMIDFIGRTVAPCANDLNFSFCAEGWDYEKNDAARGYIAGLGGWWDNKTGIEHYPQCNPWAATGLFKLEPGKEYHIQSGNINHHSFIFVDGVLVVELYDPNKGELENFSRIGLGAYHSHVQFKDLIVYRPKWEGLHEEYTGEIV